jgi:hypothetical protein
MESITCNVRENVRDEIQTDGLPPVPSSIKEQMPLLAAMMQDLSSQLGRESVQLQLQASMDLRKAFDADDYRQVSEIYRRGHGWIDWQEKGYCIGVPAAAMKHFAQRHRGNQ